MNIEVLASHRPPARFYRGGRRISDFRGEPPAAEFEPEDWVGSVTTVSGEPQVGRSSLADGRLLADAIASDPEAWLGSAHVAAFGVDPRLLVKLLDAGQRLPVHAHPDGTWASAHLGAAHGKTEAWYILSPGAVHLGLTREIGPDELAGIVERQHAAALLESMHRIEVEPGDVVHVPAGMLHAIGERVLLVEVQEPEDLSILLEWDGFAIDGSVAGHLGVGFPLALGVVERRARSGGEVARLVHRRGQAGPLLPPEVDEFFRLERIGVDGGARIARGYAIVVVTEGPLTLSAQQAASVSLDVGATALIPDAVGEVRAEGRGELIVCRPPRPGVGGAGYP